MKNLLNIGNSVSFFFIFLLIFSVIAIFSFDNNRTTSYLNPIDVPKIEFNNFTIYQINNENLLTKLQAKNAKQFDKFEEFNDVVLERLNKNIIDKIITSNAIKKEDAIFFNNGVNNFRDGYDLHTKSGVYYIDSNILDGNGDFYIKGNFQDIKGEDIYYDANKGIITAKNINAKLKVENTNKGKK